MALLSKGLTLANGVSGVVDHCDGKCMEWISDTPGPAEFKFIRDGEVIFFKLGKCKDHHTPPHTHDSWMRAPANTLATTSLVPDPASVSLPEHVQTDHQVHDPY